MALMSFIAFSVAVRSAENRQFHSAGARAARWGPMALSVAVSIIPIARRYVDALVTTERQALITLAGSALGSDKVPFYEVRQSSSRR